MDFFNTSNKGLILGSRPGEVEGETEFGADASLEYEDQMEIEFANERKRNYYDAGRQRGTVSVGGLDTGDGVGHVERVKAHYDPVKGYPRISYCDHLQVLEDSFYKNCYNPQKYEHFDGVINDYLHDSRRHDAIDNPKNQYYEAYGPMRQNIALVRLAIYNQVFPDGEYNKEDPNDRKRVGQLNQMARQIGHEIKWESRWRKLHNIVTLNFSQDDFCKKRFGKYGEEHLGAAELYKKLYTIQQKPRANLLAWVLGKKTKYEWNLRPPEQSPFCKQDMEEAMYNKERDKVLGVENGSKNLAELAVQTQLCASTMSNSVQDLTDGEREQSVEEGRNILRNLRNICMGRSERAKDGLNHKRQDLERAHAVNELSIHYRDLYQDALAANPALEFDSTFKRAQLAIGKMGYLSLEDALETASPEEAAEIRGLIEEMPDEYCAARDDTQQGLIRDVEVALGELEAQSKQRKQQKSFVTQELLQDVQYNSQIQQQQQQEILQDRQLAQQIAMENGVAPGLASQAMLSPEAGARASTNRANDQNRIMNELQQDAQMVAARRQAKMAPAGAARNNGGGNPQQMAARQQANAAVTALNSTMSNARFGGAPARLTSQMRQTNHRMDSAREARIQDHHDQIARQSSQNHNLN